MRLEFQYLMLQATGIQAILQLPHELRAVFEQKVGGSDSALLQIFVGIQV